MALLNEHAPITAAVPTGEPAVAPPDERPDRSSFGPAVDLHLDDLILPIGLAHATMITVGALVIAVHKPYPPGYEPVRLMFHGLFGMLFVGAALLIVSRQHRIFPVLIGGLALLTYSAIQARAAQAPFLTMSFAIVGLAAFALLNRRAAAFLLALAGVAEAFVVAQPGHPAPVTEWALTVGAVLLVGSLVGALVRRVEELAVGERNARTLLDLRREELAQTNARRDGFLGRMSHELRTPLNAVLGFSELIADPHIGELNLKQAEYAADIRDSATHLLALLDDVLDLSRIEHGDAPLDLEELDIGVLVGSVVALFREQAARRHVQLDLTVSRGAGYVTADARKIKQIVFNLVSNAVKFTPSGGSVEVEAHRAGRQVLVTVHDSGPGIERADQGRIFEAYLQAGQTGAPGTGLGLPVSKRLAEQHGGDVTCTSEPGYGSQFTLRLPVAGPSAPAIDTPPPAPERLRAAPLLGATGTREWLPTLVAFLLYPLAAIALPDSMRDDVNLGLLTLFVITPAVVRVGLILVHAPTSAYGVLDAFLNVIVITCAAGLVGAELSPYIILFYLWTAAVTRVHFSARLAWFHIATVAVCDAALVVFQDGNVNPLSRWLLTVGTTAVVSVIVGAFVSQLVHAAEDERDARAGAETATTDLELAARHKSDFLATMSHELRAPLNVVIGFAEVLVDRAFGDLNEKQAEYAAEIAEAGNQLLMLIDDVLDVAKLEAARMELEVGYVSINDLLTQVVTANEARAREADVTITVRTTPTPTPVVVDGQKLVRAIERLVANAVRFTPPGGEVCVEAHVAERDDTIEVVVTDTGPGIPPEDQDRIFEPFQQLEGKTRPVGGSGLGLSLARGIARLHGGDVTVTSEPGTGSRFVLAVPARTRPTAKVHSGVR